jgi:GAF domain-containing protein
LTAAYSTARLEAMLAVSRHVAESGDLTETLDLIASEAARAIGANGATIMLLGRQGLLRLGGAWGISDGLRGAFSDPSFGLALWAGPTGLALTRRRQVALADIREEPALNEWHRLRKGEGYFSLASTPLGFEGEFAGALNVYRRVAGPWPEEDLELLSFLADHAATALRVANLIERQNRQLAGLDRVLRSLREQTHEHANRIHGIAALVALGEQEEARRFIDDQINAYVSSHDAVVAGIEPAALAGLLMAEMTTARQGGIDLRVDRRSRLGRLPASLTEAEAVALVAQLLEYAFDALRDVPSSRKRVRFKASTTPEGVVFKVRDWGVQSPVLAQLDGLGPVESAGMALPSISQWMLSELIEGAHGSIEFERHQVGTSTTVTIPG